MSGGLAPSKSTVYVGNLPFSLTNNDIHKVFERFGHIAKVTILRDKETRESKGVAFVQFVQRADAVEACRELHKKEMFDRTMKCTIAKDNGRAPEFIKRREYPDKSSCYECGEEGHLSYNCPKNLLGDREQPVKKNKGQRKRARAIEDEKRKKVLNQYYKDDEELAQQQSMYEESECADYSLSDAIKHEADRQQQQQTSGYGEEEADDEKLEVPTKKKVIKKSSYFSDEEEEEEL